jgi:hypothetical protein
LIRHIAFFPLQAAHQLQKNAEAIHLHRIERNAAYQKHTLDRLQYQLQENIRKHQAYKLASEERRFSKLATINFQKALDTDYSLYAMRHDIACMQKRLEPPNWRQYQAQLHTDRARMQRDSLIARNLASIQTPRTRNRRQLLAQLSTGNDTLQNQRPEISYKSSLFFTSG